MKKEIDYEILDSHVFVTKLAGFEHSEYIQENETTEKINDDDIPLVQGKNIRNGRFVEKYDYYIKKEISDKLTRSKLTKDCILIPYVGSNLGEVGIFYHKYDCQLASNIAKIELRDNTFDLEFLKYYLQSPLGQAFLFQSKQGSAQPNITMEAIRRTNVAKYDYTYQLKIAKVLKLIDDKININNRINDNLQQLVENIYDHYFMQQSTDEDFAENYQRIYCKDLLEVKTGKQDANFGCNNGKYKFFTCSKETLRCDVPAFSGHSILIAGNGDFNVKHYSGEFNAYQRTYVLIPNDELFYGTLYMASLKLVNKFKKASAGSIVKFISKSDVENIEIIVPKDRTLLLQLNEHLYAIEKHQEEIEKLESLREFLLPMLMNGQISIA